MDTAISSLSDGKTWCAVCVDYERPGRFQSHHMAPKAVFNDHLNVANFLNQWTVPVHRGRCHLQLQRRSDGAFETLLSTLSDSSLEPTALGGFLGRLHTRGLFGFSLAAQVVQFNSHRFLPWSPDWCAELARLNRVWASTRVPRLPSTIPWGFSERFLCRVLRTRDPNLILAIVNTAVCKQQPKQVAKLLHDQGENLDGQSEILRADRLRRVAVIEHTQQAASAALDASNVLPHAGATARINAAAIAAGGCSLRARQQARALIEPLENSAAESWLHRAELFFLCGVIYYQERNWSDAYRNLIVAQYIMAMMGIQSSPAFRGDLVSSNQQDYLTPYDLLKQIPRKPCQRTYWRKEALIETGLQREVFNSLHQEAVI